ncbi:MAG: tryptophan halogenase family protein [Pseudomonadota bacterium]
MALKRVLIVGGGSAGWITAAYMDAVLNGPNNKAVAITLIESPDVGRIGVGEATVPSLRDTMRTIGLDEKTFLSAADGSFKQAIKFVDWLHKGSAYYHPFDRRPAGRVDRAGLSWLASDRSLPFASTVSVQPELCELGRAPKMLDNPDYEGPLSYAYHVDAEKLADTLCKVATSRGVTHLKGFVTEVLQHEDGRIAAVITREGMQIDADLFIDCTGFFSLLIEKTLGVEVEDYSQWLLCDRAVAMRVPHDVYYPGQRKPYTTATALSNGWVWDIGLAGRRGTGYVYSSQFLSDDDAEAELRTHEGPHSRELEARRLRFQVGRRREPWTANCVAIGLSSGFIEPLESTGLFLVELSVATLCEYFPFTDDMQGLATGYNRIIQDRYEEILDFIVLHYCLTRRDDTAFWQEVQKKERIPDRLAERLAMWRYKSPSFSDFHDTIQLFSHHTYEYVLYGMDFLRERLDQAKGRPPAPRVPRTIQERLEMAGQRLPSHDEWLQRNLGDAYRHPEAATDVARAG